MLVCVTCLPVTECRPIAAHTKAHFPSTQFGSVCPVSAIKGFISPAKGLLLALQPLDGYSVTGRFLADGP